MTVILYNKGVLYGDRRRMVRSLIFSYVDGDKLFMSPDKQFAFGVSGTLPEDRTMPAYLTFLRKALEHIHANLGRKKLRGTLVDMLGELGDNPPIDNTIVVTRDLVASIYPGGDRVIISDPIKPVAMGSSGTILLGMVIAGVTPKQAYAMTSEKYDAFTGPTPDCVKMSSLKPFIIRGDQ